MIKRGFCLVIKIKITNIAIIYINKYAYKTQYSLYNFKFMKSNYLLTTLFLMLFTNVSAQNIKSISILGDSYSTFENYLTPDTNAVWYWNNPKNTDVSNVKETWWHKYIVNNNYQLCINNSFSGSTICNTGYGKDDYSDRSFIRRMNNLGSPDVIFIFGATNDSWSGAPIGNYKYSDWNSKDLYTFRPAMSYMLDYMIKRYPNVELHFILNDGLKNEITESVEIICKHYNVDCIKLINIDKQNGHPSIKGMNQITDQIESHLKIFYKINKNKGKNKKNSK